VNISLGSISYRPCPVCERDLALTRRIDVSHMDYPFAGARMLAFLLRQEGLAPGRKHVSTPMNKMGIEALDRRPSTSKPEPAHKVYAYLLKDKEVNRPNQVWAMDITYIPMAKGYCHLAAVVDWFTRRCSPGGCRSPWRRIEALEDVLAKHGKLRSSTPTRAANSPPGSSPDFSQGTASPSMDGQGAWSDNVFVERAVAPGEIRGSLPRRLRQWQRAQGFARQLLRLLQHEEIAPGP
jgi:putative transposase